MEKSALPIFDIFSKRQMRLRGEMPDVYIYDDLPNPLRIQIVHIWSATIGDQEQSSYDGNAKAAYEYIVNVLRHEYGVFSLHSENQYPMMELVHFFGFGA